MDISNLLNDVLDNQVVENIANQVGVDKSQASSAISTAVPVLISALNNNAKQGGADGILNALSNKHDGSILDDIGGFLNGGDFSDGSGILSHILGGKQGGVENSISKSTGLSGAQIAKILAIVAPIVMGYLGKQKASQGGNMDGGGITDLLGGLMGGASQSGIDMGSIEKMLNPKSGGGGLLGSIFGSFFGKK